nr:MAG TPA: repressor protein CI [Caudoviricetes sp.]
MGNILSRIQEIACKEGITIGALERGIGASKGVLSRAIANGTDIQSKWIRIIVENYPLYSTRWLLTGEGPMLRDSKNPEESTMDHSPEKVQSTSSDIVTLRLMDKLDEKDSIIKDKEAKIDQLQSELRHQSAELAALKAQAQHLHGHGYRDHSDNEGPHPGLGQ